MSRQSTTRVTADEDPPTVPAAEYRVVPLAAVFDSPLNPRRHDRNGNSPEVLELAASIRTHGVLEPLVVRASPHEAGMFEIVAGSRRRRAAAKAGLAEVPVTIREVTDTQLLELALAENVHRRNMHPLDEAQALAELQRLDPIYADTKALASRVGRSDTYVRDRLKLLKLDAIVVEALEQDVITVRHAEVIARLTVDQHRRALEECFSKLLTVGKNDWTPRAKALEARDWEALRSALVGTRDLERFVAEAAKVDLSTPEVQEALRPIVEQARHELVEGVRKETGDLVKAGEIANELVDEAVEDAVASLLQLSTKGGYSFTRNDARAAKVVHKDDWKAAKPGSCTYVRQGIIVHPAGVEPKVIDVCVSKKCEKHRPRPTYRPDAWNSPEAVAKRKREEEQRQAAEQAWKAIQPAATAAMVAHVVKTATLTPALVTLVLRGDHAVKRIAKEYGVKLTAKTVAAVLALYTVDDYSRDHFIRTTKPLGFDLPRFEATHAKTSEVKPAKAKARKAAKKATAA